MQTDLHECKNTWKKQLYCVNVDDAINTVHLEGIYEMRAGWGGYSFGEGVWQRLLFVQKHLLLIHAIEIAKSSSGGCIWEQNFSLTSPSIQQVPASYTAPTLSFVFLHVLHRKDPKQDFCKSAGYKMQRYTKLHKPAPSVDWRWLLAFLAHRSTFDPTSRVCFLFIFMDRSIQFLQAPHTSIKIPLLSTSKATKIF